MFQVVKDEVLNYKDKLENQEKKVKEVLTSLQIVERENETLRINLELLSTKATLAYGDLDKILERVRFKREKLAGFESSSIKGEINPHLKFIAENPMMALKGIENQLELLKLTVMRDANTIQEIKSLNIEVFFKGEVAQIRLPSQKGVYCFSDLKEDVCIYFNQDIDTAVLLDDTYSIWPDRF